MTSTCSRAFSWRGTPLAVLGVACALMVLEIQRMPVAHVVSFSMFAPLPYAAEAALIAGLGWRAARGRPALGASSTVRIVVAVLAVVSAWLVLEGSSFSSPTMLAIRVVYRMATGLLVVLWSERLLPLGARRAAVVIAAACAVSGVATLALAAVPTAFASPVLVAVAVAGGAAFVAFRPVDAPPRCASLAVRCPRSRAARGATGWRPWGCYACRCFRGAPLPRLFRRGCRCSRPVRALPCRRPSAAAFSWGPPLSR